MKLKRKICLPLLCALPVFCFAISAQAAPNDAASTQKKDAVTSATRPAASTANKSDAVTSATHLAATSADSKNIDAITSATIVKADSLQHYKPKGFTADTSKEKVLFVVADPRKDSITYDLAQTAMAFFESQGWEVELRDLYDIKFDPVITKETFFNAKDGFGTTPPAIKKEQGYIAQAKHIIFVYPNWHDTPNPMIKGYMERVFAKQFAYKTTPQGLEGLLKDKDIYTIMNCGFLGGGQGFIGDGIGKNDELWDTYMRAFKVFDDDTAAFWGVTNKGRFMNDQSPRNNAENYKEQIEALRNVLRMHLKRDFAL